jgi:hypothetical protein
MTLRQRWFGNRSTRFLAIMALGLVASLPSGLWPVVNWEPLLRALMIFVGMPLSSALDYRVRAIPMLLFIAWISVFVEVPLALGLGFAVMAALLFSLDDRATEEVDSRAKAQTRIELAPLVRRLTLLKIGNAVAIAPAIATLEARLLIEHGHSDGTIMLLLAVGILVYAYVVYVHVRDFRASVVGRPA